MPSGIYERKPLTEEKRKEYSERMSLVGKNHGANNTPFKKGHTIKVPANKRPRGEDFILKLNPRKGHKISDSHKAAIRESILGCKHPSWKGGISSDKAHRKELKKKWIADNRDYVNYTNSIRAAKRKKVEGDYTYSDWLEIKLNQNYCCAICGTSEPEIKLTIDHIIPLSKDGSNKKENIQGLCRSCNSRKKDKLISNHYKAKLD